MATSDKKREVPLTLKVDTVGEDNVSRLAKEIRDLGKSGGDAAPQFEALAQQVEKIASQRDAVVTLEKLQQEITTLAAAEAQAAEKAAQFGAELKAQADITAVYRANQEKLSQALNENKAALAANKDALKALTIVKQEQGGLDAAQVQRIINLRTENLGLSKVIRELNSDYKVAAGLTAEVVADQKALQTAYDKSASSLDAIGAKLTSRTAAMDTASAATRALGVDTSSLEKAQALLNASLTDTVASANKAQQAVVDLAAARKVEAEAAAAEAAATAASEAAFIREADVFAANKKALLELSEQRAKAAAESVAAAEKEQLAANELAAAKAKMAEADRLTLIEMGALESQRKQGLASLQAERESLAESAKFAQNYAAEQTQASAKAELALKNLAEAAARAKQQLADAFTTTGATRGSAAILGDIEKINVALRTLATNASVTDKEFGAAFVSAQAKTLGLRKELQAIGPAATESTAALGFLKGQIAQIAALYGGLQLATAFVEANVQIQTLQRTLFNITGSTTDAALAIDQLREAANRNGLAVSGLSDSFIQFQASARSAGVSSAVISQTFDAVTDASGKMGLSTERAGLVLNGLSQIAGKGVVSMEELRGQIGDSLPGALKIAASSLGLTIAELTKLVESGKLASSDFLPAFAKAMTESFGAGGKQAEGLLQSFNRLKNAITLVAQSASDSAAFKALASSMDFLAKNIGGVVTGLEVLAGSFIAIKAIKIADEFLGFSAAMNVYNAAQGRTVVATQLNTVAITEQAAAKTVNTEATVVNAEAHAATAVAMRTEATATGLGTAATIANTEAKVLNTAASTASIGSIGAGAVAATSKVGGLVAGLVSLASPMNVFAVGATLAVTFGDKLGTLIGEMSDYGDTLRINEGLIDQQNAKTKALVAANELVGASMVQVQVKYQKVIDAAEKKVIVSEKLAKAVQIEAQTSEKLAQLSGNEAAARDTAVFAIQRQVVASQAVVTNMTTELAAMEAQRAAIVKLAGGYDQLDATKKKMIDDDDKAIEKLKAEVEQRTATTDSLKLELTQRLLAVTTYGDQSKAVEQLYNSYLTAKDTLKAVNEQYNQGNISLEKLTEATKAAAVAENQYRDAIKDQYEQMNLSIAAQKTAQQQRSIGLEISAEESRATEIRLRQSGQEYAANQEAIKQKDLSITQRGQEATVLKTVATQQLVNALNEKAELERLGPLTDAKKVELQARIDAAKAAGAEADLAKARVETMKAEADQLKINSGLLDAQAGSFGALGDAASAAAQKLDVFSAAGIKARNASDLSVLGKTGSLGKNSDGSAFGQTGQLNIPSGFHFDQQAFNRARAMNPLDTLNMQNFVVADSPSMTPGKPNPTQGGKPLVTPSSVSTGSDINTYAGASSITTPGAAATSGGSSAGSSVGGKVTLQLNVGSGGYAEFQGTQTAANTLAALIGQAKNQAGVS